MQFLLIAKALADDTRLRILAMLALPAPSGRELAVGEVCEILAMSQPRVSRHLKVLTEAGLLCARRDGLRIYYRACGDGPGADALAALAPLWATDDAALAEAEAARRTVAARAERSRRFFDAVAPDFAALREELLGGFDLARALAARIPHCRTLADLGCGAGELLTLASDHADHLIGVDHSPRMLELARAALADAAHGPDASLRLGDIAHLPLADGEADAAVLSLTLHHLPDPAAGLAEAFRVLAPGGFLLIAELAKHEREELRERHGDQRLGFARAELEGLAGAAGLVLASAVEQPLPTGLSLIIITARKPARP